MAWVRFRYHGFGHGVQEGHRRLGRRTVHTFSHYLLHVSIVSEYYYYYTGVIGIFYCTLVYSLNNKQEAYHLHIHVDSHN